MRYTFVAVLVLSLAACGSLGTAEIPTPVVVTQVVQQTVVVKETTVVKETVIVTATPKPITPTAPPATPTPAPVGGKWELTEDVSSFDDSKTVVLVLEAENDISGPVGDYRPALILRCKEKETEAYINTGMAPDIEGLSDTATVRMRFGKDEAFTAQAGKSTDGEALFLPAPETFIDTLLNYEQLVFQFTPFSASPAEMTFDLRGLDKVIEPLRAACS